MIDVHAHILPGVDDGARTEAESVEMLREAASAGITVIVATPHVSPGGYDRQRHIAAWNDLRPIAAAQGIGLMLGGELNIAIAREQARFDPFCFTLTPGGARFVLLELDFDTEKPEAAFMISDIFRQRIVPILAHPERCLFVRRDPQSLIELRSYGCLLQVDARAFSRPLWHAERRAVGKMLRAGLIDCLASDAHRPGDYARLLRADKATGGMLAKQTENFVIWQENDQQGRTI